MLCSSPENVAGTAMSPKRAKSRSHSIAVDTLYVLLLAHVERQEERSVSLGGYVSKAGPFPKVIMQWAAFTAEVLKLAPSGLVHWDCVKQAFVKLYDKKPTLDPHHSNAQVTVIASAEEAATGLRRLLSGLRRCA
eukprot:1449735-Lingulodinium_polyedra.AAC.1